MGAAETDTKARLLEAAQALYLAEGLASFSLREVARRVGVSAAAVYRHFPSKEALLEAVYAKGFETFASYLVRALAEPTPRARLVASGRLYRRFALEHTQDYRVIFMGAADTCDDTHVARRASGGTQAPTFQFLVDRVSECVRAKILARRDANELATTIWAFVHGLCSLRITGHLARVGDDEAFGRFFDHAVERLLVGLGPMS